MSVELEASLVPVKLLWQDVSSSIGLGLVWWRQAHVIMSKWLSPGASLKSFQLPHTGRKTGEGRIERTRERRRVEKPFSAPVGEWSRWKRWRKDILFRLTLNTVAMRKKTEESFIPCTSKHTARSQEMTKLYFRAFADAWAPLKASGSVTVMSPLFKGISQRPCDVH